MSFREGVGLVVGLASVAGLLWERAWWWQERKQAKIAACPGHRWIYFSLHDDLATWNRSCSRCPAHEVWYDQPRVGDCVKVGTGKNTTYFRVEQKG